MPPGTSARSALEILRDPIVLYGSGLILSLGLIWMVWAWLWIRRDVVNRHETSHRILAASLLLAAHALVMVSLGADRVRTFVADGRLTHLFGAAWALSFPVLLIASYIRLLPYVKKISRSEEASEGDPIMKEIRGLAAEMNVVRAPVVWLSEVAPIPFVVGTLRRAVLVVPRDLGEALIRVAGTAAEGVAALRRFILLHELAHIRSRDYLLLSWWPYAARWLKRAVPMIIAVGSIGYFLRASGSGLVAMLATVVGASLILLAPLALVHLLVLSASRAREVLADSRAGLLLMPGDRDWLLQRTEGRRSEFERLLARLPGLLGGRLLVPASPTAIVGRHGSGLRRLTATHPAPTQRAAALRLGGGIGDSVEVLSISWQAAVWLGATVALLFLYLGMAGAVVLRGTILTVYGAAVAAGLAMLVANWLLAPVRYGCVYGFPFIQLVQAVALRCAVAGAVAIAVTIPLAVVTAIRTGPAALTLPLTVGVVFGEAAWLALCVGALLRESSMPARLAAPSVRLLAAFATIGTIGTIGFAVAIGGWRTSEWFSLAGVLAGFACLFAADQRLFRVMLDPLVLRLNIRSTTWHASGFRALVLYWLLVGTLVAVPNEIVTRLSRAVLPLWGLPLILVALAGLCVVTFRARRRGVSPLVDDMLALEPVTRLVKRERGDLLQEGRRGIVEAYWRTGRSAWELWSVADVLALGAPDYRDELATFVLEHGIDGCGFAFRKGGEPNIHATWLTVRALRAAGRLDRINSSQLEIWLVGRRLPGAGFAEIGKFRSDLTATYRAVECLSVLGATFGAAWPDAAWLERAWQSRKMTARATFEAVSVAAMTGRLERLRPAFLKWLDANRVVLGDLSFDQRLRDVSCYLQTAALLVGADKLEAYLGPVFPRLRRFCTDYEQGLLARLESRRRASGSRRRREDKGVRATAVSSRPSVEAGRAAPHMRIDPAAWPLATDFARVFLAEHYSQFEADVEVLARSLGARLQELGWEFEIDGSPLVGLSVADLDPETRLTLLAAAVLLTELPIGNRPDPDDIRQHAWESAKRCKSSDVFARQFAKAVVGLYKIRLAPDVSVGEGERRWVVVLNGRPDCYVDKQIEDAFKDPGVEAILDERTGLLVVRGAGRSEVRIVVEPREAELIRLLFEQFPGPAERLDLDRRNWNAGTLEATMSHLRHRMGGDKEWPILTVRKRGYRLNVSQCLLINRSEASRAST